MAQLDGATGGRGRLMDCRLSLTGCGPSVDTLRTIRHLLASGLQCYPES